MAMMARNVDNEALVCRRTIRELSAQAHELSISHRAEAHQLLIPALITTYDMSMTISSEGVHKAFMATTTTMAMKATNVDNKAPWA